MAASIFFCGNYPGVTVQQTIQFEAEKPFELAIVAYSKRGPLH